MSLTKRHGLDCLELSALTAKILELCPGRPQPEVIFDRVDAVHQPGTNNKRSLDPEYRIAAQIPVPIQEEMRDKGAISRRADHEVDMCRPKRMAPHRREQLPGGTIIGNRVAYRHDGSESKATGVVGAKTGPQMPLRLILILNIVELIGRGLPDFHQGVCDRPSLSP
jgi:hypothetical protein